MIVLNTIIFLKIVEMVSPMLYIFYDFKCMAKRISFKAIRKYFGDFPGGQVAKTSHSQCRGLGSILGQRTRPHVPQLRPSRAK